MVIRTKIMYVITGLQSGGAERMLRNLAVFHDRMRFDITVVSCRDLGFHGKAIRSAGVNVICLGMRPDRFSLSVIFKLAREIRDISPDVLHSWLYHADLIVALSRILVPRRSTGKWLWNVRCSDASLGEWWSPLRIVVAILSFMSRFPDVVIYNSKSGLERHRELGYRPKREMILSNGFDCERFHPDESARNWLIHKLGLLDCGDIVVMVARFDPMKDFSNFLRSINIVCDSYPSCRAILIGCGVTSDNRELMESISSLGLDRSVSLLGEIDDLARIMAAASIVALSSAYGEGFPNVLGEAMSCGTPCVATDVGDSAYIIGDTGVVVPRRDHDAFASGILRLLGESSGQRIVRRNRCRMRIQEKFSLPVVAGRYERIYTWASRNRIKRKK